MGPVDFVVHCSNDNEHCIKLHFRSKYPTAEALVVLDACPSLDIYIYIQHKVTRNIKPGSHMPLTYLQ